MVSQISEKGSTPSISNDAENRISTIYNPSLELEKKTSLGYILNEHSSENSKETEIQQESQSQLPSLCSLSLNHRKPLPTLPARHKYSRCIVSSCNRVALEHYNRCAIHHISMTHHREIIVKRGKKVVDVEANQNHTRKQLELCTLCNNPRHKSSTRCVDCEKARQQSRQKKLAAIPRDGTRCVRTLSCTNPVLEGKFTCERHLEKQRAFSRRKMQMKRQFKNANSTTHTKPLNLASKHCNEFHDVQ
ncbi:hypothetical protein F4801DRAFT_545512 [Xylaria longipes]|nr:hypothetical protein F4801DRAFT_545512 [Xylaria longipes]